MLIFVSDQLYTRKHPNTGEGITCMQDIDEKYMNNICKIRHPNIKKAENMHGNEEYYGAGCQ